jgi:hypothetical protein
LSPHSKVAKFLSAALISISLIYCVVRSAI